MLMSLSALLVMTPLRALESFVDGAPTIRQVTCNIYIYTPIILQAMVKRIGALSHCLMLP